MLSVTDKLMMLFTENKQILRWRLTCCVIRHIGLEASLTVVMSSWVLDTGDNYTQNRHKPVRVQFIKWLNYLGETVMITLFFNCSVFYFSSLLKQKTLFNVFMELHVC